MNTGFDTTRTCEGCANVRTSHWLGDKYCWRCMAPGEFLGKGYVVGIGKPNPYRPAWCPLIRKENDT